MNRKLLLTIQVISLCLISSGCSVNSKQAYLSNVTLGSGKWILINVQGQEIVKQDTNHPIFLEFNETDLKLFGYAGCNRIFGAYSINGNLISFARIGSTKTICADIKVEQNFLNALHKVDRYQVEGEKLQLFNKANLLISMRLLTD